MKSNNLSIAIAIVIAGALIGACILIGLIYRPASTTVAAGTGTAAQQAPSKAADVSKVNITGEPYIGNPNAQTVVAYWFDYQCPFCKQNEETLMPQLIADYVTTGKVKLVFKDYEFLGTDSQTAGVIARAVWEAAPDKFYQWHKAMFDAQGQENGGWASEANIMTITKNALGADVAAKIEALLTTNRAQYQQQIDADKTEGSGFGVSGTPSFIIGKQLIIGAQPYTQVKAAIDTAIAGK